MRRITFTVVGKPEPKGSTKIVPRRRFPFHVERFKDLLASVAVIADNDALRKWQKDIATSAMVYRGAGVWPASGAVEMSVVFYLERPGYLNKAKAETPEHLKPPDVDKLLRAILDGLSGVIWVDDKQVVKATAEKKYAEIEGMPRAAIWIGIR